MQSLHAEVVNVGVHLTVDSTARAAYVRQVMHRFSRLGRGLLFTSVALSVYTVATVKDRGQAAGRELAVAGAGIGGGVLGGALAGLACGPGAPVCVAVGAFVGGAAAAFGMDSRW